MSPETSRAAAGPWLYMETLHDEQPHYVADNLLRSSLRCQQETHLHVFFRKHYETRSPALLPFVCVLIETLVSSLHFFREISTKFLIYFFATLNNGSGV